MKANEILVFDTETTGLPNWKTPSEGDDQPHIVQLAAHVFDMEAMKVRQSMDVIIRPTSWESGPEALETHGITKEYAMDVGIPEILALQMFLELWNGRKRVAYNTTFDNRIIRIATKRFCDEQIQESWRAGEYECAMLASRKIIGGKNPTLQEAHKHFLGYEFGGAHSAIADVNACLAVYLAIKNQESMAA